MLRNEVHMSSFEVGQLSTLVLEANRHCLGPNSNLWRNVSREVDESQSSNPFSQSPVISGERLEIACVCPLRRMDRQTEGKVDRQTDGRMDRQADGQIDRQTEWWRDRLQTEWWTGRQTDGRQTERLVLEANRHCFGPDSMDRQTEWWTDRHNDRHTSLERDHKASSLKVHSRWEDMTASLRT